MLEKLILGTLHAALSDQQISAIKYSIEIAKIIQIQFPNIANEYHSGDSLLILNQKYHIDELFSIKPKTAQEAIRIAIGGYQGQLEMLNIPPFIGMIPFDEFKRIGKKHNIDNSKKIGIEYHKHGKGIFSINKEERIKIGKKSAKKLLELKTGIHAQTPEQRRLLGQKTIIAQGGIIYSQEEFEYIKLLASDKLYQKGKLIKAAAIAKKVNEKFHQSKEIRNGNKIKKIISRYGLNPNKSSQT